MHIRNVSGVVRTEGSDYDIDIWLQPVVWNVATKTLELFHIGSWRRPETYRIALGDVEAFLVNEQKPDAITLTVESNIDTQRAWDWMTLVGYTHAKRRMSHLSGVQRKQAKAQLASRYGLSPAVYATA